MSSPAFKWLSHRTKTSKGFFYGFCVVLGSIPVTLGYLTMKFTNSNNADLEARLRRSADPHTSMVGQVTTARMNEFLGELQRKEKEKADDRYFAALGWRPSKNTGIPSQQPDTVGEVKKLG